MPNHITSRLKITGDATKVAEVFYFIKADEPDEKGELPSVRPRENRSHAQSPRHRFFLSGRGRHEVSLLHGRQRTGAQCDVGLSWMLTTLDSIGSSPLSWYVHCSAIDYSTGAIIGNIHDNPELLVGKSNLKERKYEND